MKAKPDPIEYLCLNLLKDCLMGSPYEAHLSKAVLLLRRPVERALALLLHVSPSVRHLRATSEKKLIKEFKGISYNYCILDAVNFLIKGKRCTANSKIVIRFCIRQRAEASPSFSNYVYADCPTYVLRHLFAYSHVLSTVQQLVCPNILIGIHPD